MIARKRVSCELCASLLKSITHAHLKKHNMTFKEYTKMFPNSNVISQYALFTMHESRKKFLEKGTFIPPMKLKSEEEKREIAKKVSHTVKEMMKNPVILKKMVENRVYGDPWNKGLTIDDPRVRKATEKRALTLENKPKNLIFISKIEKKFLDELQRIIGCHVYRQKRIFVDENLRNVDGFFHTYFGDVIIEIDGVYWHSSYESKLRDNALDDFCSRNKIHIFRFKDVEVYNIEDRKNCINKIVAYHDHVVNEYEFREFGMCREDMYYA